MKLVFENRHEYNLVGFGNEQVLVVNSWKTDIYVVDGSTQIGSLSKFKVLSRFNGKCKTVVIQWVH